MITAASRREAMRGHSPMPPDNPRAPSWRPLRAGPAQGDARPGFAVRTSDWRATAHAAGVFSLRIGPALWEGRVPAVEPPQAVRRWRPVWSVNGSAPVETDGYCGAGVIHPKGTAQVRGPRTPGSASSSREAANLPDAGFSRHTGPQRRGRLRQTVIATGKRPLRALRGAGPALP
jgi:hypothetical protein